MAEKKKLSNEDRRRFAAEQLWLDYYNQTLYKQGLITESERNRMTNRINARKRSEPSR
ncbi:MAG: hypothetical protein ACI3W7_08675 [Oscillospiraceae bacterium]